MRIDVLAVMDTRSHSRLPGLRCILVTFGAGGIHIGSQGHTAWSCEVSGPHTGRVGGTRRIGTCARVHGAGRLGGTSVVVPRPGGGAGWGPIGQGRHGGGGALGVQARRTRAANSPWVWYPSRSTTTAGLLTARSATSQTWQRAPNSNTGHG